MGDQEQHEKEVSYYEGLNSSDLNTQLNALSLVLKQYSCGEQVDHLFPHLLVALNRSIEESVKILAYHAIAACKLDINRSVAMIPTIFSDLLSQCVELRIQAIKCLRRLPTSVIDSVIFDTELMKPLKAKESTNKFYTRIDKSVMLKSHNTVPEQRPVPSTSSDMIARKTQSTRNLDPNNTSKKDTPSQSEEQSSERSKKSLRRDFSTNAKAKSRNDKGGQNNPTGASSSTSGSANGGSKPQLKLALPSTASDTFTTTNAPLSSRDNSGNNIASPKTKQTTHQKGLPSVLTTADTQLTLQSLLITMILSDNSALVRKHVIEFLSNYILSPSFTSPPETTIISQIPTSKDSSGDPSPLQSPTASTSRSPLSSPTSSKTTHSTSHTTTNPNTHTNIEQNSYVKLVVNFWSSIITVLLTKSSSATLVPCFEVIGRLFECACIFIRRKNEQDYGSYFHKYIELVSIGVMDVLIPFIPNLSSLLLKVRSKAEGKSFGQSYLSQFNDRIHVVYGLSHLFEIFFYHHHNQVFKSESYDVGQKNVQDSAHHINYQLNLDVDVTQAANSRINLNSLKNLKKSILSLVQIENHRVNKYKPRQYLNKGVGLLVIELVETYFIPLLDSYDSSLVFQTAYSLLSLCNHPHVPRQPQWVVSVCVALFQLLDRPNIALSHSNEMIVDLLTDSLQLIGEPEYLISISVKLLPRIRAFSVSHPESKLEYIIRICCALVKFSLNSSSHDVLDRFFNHRSLPHSLQPAQILPSFLPNMKQRESRPSEDHNNSTTATTSGSSSSSSSSSSNINNLDISVFDEDQFESILLDQESNSSEGHQFRENFCGCLFQTLIAFCLVNQPNKENYENKNSNNKCSISNSTTDPKWFSIVLRMVILHQDIITNVSANPKPTSTLNPNSNPPSQNQSSSSPTSSSSSHSINSFHLDSYLELVDMLCNTSKYLPASCKVELTNKLNKYLGGVCRYLISVGSYLVSTRMLFLVVTHLPESELSIHSYALLTFIQNKYFGWDYNFGEIKPNQQGKGFLSFIDDADTSSTPNIHRGHLNSSHGGSKSTLVSTSANTTTTTTMGATSEDKSNSHQHHSHLVLILECLFIIGIKCNQSKNLILQMFNKISTNFKTDTFITSRCNILKTRLSSSSSSSTSSSSQEKSSNSRNDYSHLMGQDTFLFTSTPNILFQELINYNKSGLDTSNNNNNLNQTHGNTVNKLSDDVFIKVYSIAVNNLNADSINIDHISSNIHKSLNTNSNNRTIHNTLVGGLTKYSLNSKVQDKIQKSIHYQNNISIPSSQQNPFSFLFQNTEKTLSSPSDPISVTVTHKTHPSTKTLTLNVRVTNIANIYLSNLKCVISFRGKIDVSDLNSLSNTHTIGSLHPNQSTSLIKEFKLYQFHANSIFIVVTMDQNNEEPPQTTSIMNDQISMSSSLQNSASTLQLSNQQQQPGSSQTSQNNHNVSSAQLTSTLSPSTSSLNVNQSTSNILSTYRENASMNIPITTTTNYNQSHSPLSFSSKYTLKLSPTSSINCLPFRLNMNELVLPLDMSSSAFSKYWDRYPIGVKFDAPAQMVTPISLSLWLNYLEKFYKIVLNWQYLHSFQLGCVGNTWWNEKIFIAINGFYKSTPPQQQQQVFGSTGRHFSSSHHNSNDANGPVELGIRVELRSPSSSLLQIIHDNHSTWQVDLLHFLHSGHVGSHHTPSAMTLYSTSPSRNLVDMYMQQISNESNQHHRHHSHHQHQHHPIHVGSNDFQILSNWHTLKDKSIL
eukprot:TRINITY_DN1493_c1_g1_i1.p1 TRINITY_DN1493_c1_g1~~TRINITY_DN1493_c1_g1_i1.p1  ORF type:complete len:1753 (+),score=401.66 TRINITY_DN1493_c1_g1_i1:33-5291(+)